MEEHWNHPEVEVGVEENHLHHQVACMDCTWALAQRLGQTSWVVAVWTLKCWGSQRNGWSPSVQTHGQEAQQYFLVAAKMGETLLNLGQLVLRMISGHKGQQTAVLVSAEEKYLPSNECPVEQWQKH